MNQPAPDDAPPFDPEGPESEWKEQLPRPHAVARTMSAFANGVGGRLWVGVRDDGHPVGVGPQEESVWTELRRIAGDVLVPPLEIDLVRRPYCGRVLVEARVEARADRPVLAPGRDGILTAFVRDGASTRRAPRALIKAWSRNSPRPSFDAKTRRLLTELKARAAFDVAGPTVPELARFARMGQRATRRSIVELERAGLVTDRGGGHYGLTPEGHRRAR